MRNVIVTLLALTAWLSAASLSVVEGKVHAHTEVFGDTSIDPETTAITSYLTMPGSLESITGQIVVSMSALQSENKKRDENMHESMESEKFPNAVYVFDTITKSDNGYKIDGQLTLHGVTKPLSLQAKMNLDGTTVKMSGTSTLKMTDFGIEPPVLLFLTVRDQVDIDFDVTFTAQ
jgi:polyisoprenoid-binding protein YceI